MGFARVLKEFFPPKSKFSTADIPDLTGQVAIVTGGKSGLGKATAQVLLEHNATVLIACRSEAKENEAITELESATGKKAQFLHLDLADLASVKQAGESFVRSEKQLHILFNNAGVMHPPRGLLTAQGYDLQFGTSVLGHFYFTKLLLPVLLNTAKNLPGFEPRVVNTSSSSAYMVTEVKLEALVDGPLRNSANTLDLYSYSKFGNVQFSNEIARRYGEQGLVSVSLNPGNLDTNLVRHLNRFMAKLLAMLFYPPAQGALTTLWAGTTAEGKAINGEFLIPWARIGKQPEGALNPEECTKIWNWCEEQVKVFEDGGRDRA